MIPKKGRVVWEIGIEYEARDQARHIIPQPGPRLVRVKPARDPLMHPIQLAPNQIRRHALNDPARILSVPLKY